MTFSIIRFLAWRYVTGVSFSSSINTMIKICALSMFVGTFSLALVTGIMRGFEQETYKKLKNITPDLTIYAADNGALEVQALTEYLKKHHGTAITNMAPYTIQPVLLEHTDQASDAVVGFLKVVNPHQEEAVATLHNKITPHTPLPALLSATEIVIGKGIAQELVLQVGDTITLIYNPENSSVHSGQPAKKTVTITGILNTGIADTDNHIGICSQDCYAQLVDNPEVTHLGINTKGNPELLKKQLASLEGLTVTSWKDDYPALVSALTLERYAMIFLLSLITLVASMNVLSLIFMVTAYKKTDCALLLSLGATKRDLIAIFMLFSLIIAGASSLLGIGAAYGVALLMQAYPCITLPDIYYVTHLPVEPRLTEFVLVFIGACLMSSGAALIALQNIKKLSITHIFRFE